MNGALLGLGLLGFGGTWWVFYHADHGVAENKRHGWERGAAILAGCGTFAVVLALAGTFAQMWTDASEGVGLFILISVDVAAIAFGYSTIVKGRAHHRRSTLALGIIAGGAAALTYGGLLAIKANGAKYLASAAHGVTTSAGHVGAAHDHESSGGLGVFLLLAAGVVLAGIVISKHRKGEVKDVPRAVAAGKGGGNRGGRPSGQLGFAGDDA